MAQKREPDRREEDAKILKEARENLLISNDYEGDAEGKFREDVKFVNADARNGDQWPASIMASRTAPGMNKPTLTINKTRTHCKMVINSALENQSSIKINATGGGATYKSAQMLQALIRRIEYISGATIAYKEAIKFQVWGGLGYVTLDTAYVSDKSFDQDIYIRGVRSPTNVRLDPDTQRPDGLDANWGLVFESMLRKKFNRKYPRFKDKIGKSTLGEDGVWVDDKHVLVAKYYRRAETKDTLVTYINPEGGKRITTRVSEIENKELIAGLMAQIESGEIDGETREVFDQKVRWYLIGGDCVIDRGDWAGKYIPIIRLPGDEVVMDGKVDRKGLVRYMIDSQRMMNYFASGGVEFVAGQTKTPFVASARAIEGQEGWKTANVDTFAVLIYNDWDDEAPEGGRKIDAPTRLQPPTGSPAMTEGWQAAEKWMMASSGQYQAQMGQNENAKSGRAISERKVQGDTATYDFNDNQGDFYRAIGIQCLDLIPKIYDTARILTITHDDGTESLIHIDPDQAKAIDGLPENLAIPDALRTAAKIVFNPNVGEYDVVADPGPNYATQRQEAWNAISLILQNNMALAGTIGDLLFKYGDFPGAADIMERLRKEIAATKPYLFGEGETPGIQALKAQLDKLGKLNAELVTKLAEMQLEKKDYTQENDIKVYEAHTKRLDVLENQPGGEKAFQALIQQAVADALREHLMPVKPEPNGADAQ